MPQINMIGRNVLSTVPPKNEADSVIGWHMHKTEMTRFHFHYNTFTVNKLFQNFFSQFFYFSYLSLNIYEERV